MSPYEAWPFLSDTSHPLLSAVWAVFIHGVIGLIVVGPLIWHSRHRITYGLIAFAGGSALDFDHVIAAGTLNPHALETLPGGRPATHSLLFVLALALLTLAAWPPLARVLRGSRAQRSRWVAPWSVFAVNCAHVLFDAAGGRERILYPSTAIHGIPWLLCPIGVLLLMAGSFAVDGWTAAGRPLERAPAA